MSTICTWNQLAFFWSLGLSTLDSLCAFFLSRPGDWGDVKVGCPWYHCVFGAFTGSEWQEPKSPFPPLVVLSDQTNMFTALLLLTT